MRTTVTLDDKLLKEAKSLCAEESVSKLLHEAVQALVERQHARRLIALGGSMPEIGDVPRRRAAG